VNPWDQQPNESDRAYKAASVYFSMGAERSLAKVARAVNKSLTLIERWSSRHEWVARARERDTFLRRLESEAFEHEFKEAARAKYAARFASQDRSARADQVTASVASR
jgi:hypothetical protein